MIFNTIYLVVKNASCWKLSRYCRHSTDDTALCSVFYFLYCQVSRILCILHRGDSLMHVCNLDHRREDLVLLFLFSHLHFWGKDASCIFSQPDEKRHSLQPSYPEAHGGCTLTDSRPKSNRICIYRHHSSPESNLHHISITALSNYYDLHTFNEKKIIKENTAMEFNVL